MESVHRSRWLALTVVALLLSAKAHADVAACPAIEAMDPAAKARVYCENFNPYNGTKQVAAAQVNCLRFYAFVVRAVQDICGYQEDVAKFQRNDQALIAALDKDRGQATSDASAATVDSRARALSRKWWDQFLKDVQNLDLIYRDYMEGTLAPLSRFGVEVLVDEVQGATCGRTGTPVSLNLLGLAGVSTDDAQKTYLHLGPLLNKLTKDMMVNSNRAKKTADMLQEILNNAKSGSATQLPGAPTITGGSDPSIPEPPGLAGKVAKSVVITKVVGDTKDDMLGLLKLSHGKLAAASGAVDGALALLDVGLRWVEHHKLDDTSKVFIGINISILALTKVGAISVGGWMGAAIAAGLTWLEAMARAAEMREVQARLTTYLPFAKDAVKGNSVSHDISARWHFEFYAAPSDIDGRGNLPTNPVPSSRPHENCDK